MNTPARLVFLTGLILWVLSPLTAQETDLILPTMLIESKAEEGPELKELKGQEWEASLPDEAFTLPAPPPLTNPELEALFESPASLLPSGSLALPPDWNLLTSLGITLGAPYHFGAEASLIRLGKTLPFQLDFSHRTLDSYWNGQGLESPGSGFSHRSTAMEFQAAGDPSQSWQLEMALREDSTGLQRKVPGFHSAEFRKARMAGEALVNLDGTWALSAGIWGTYTQKLLAGTLPSGAALGEAGLSPGILWNIGSLGKARFDLKASIKSLESDIQADFLLPGGAAVLGWELFPLRGWTLNGQASARFEDGLWLFPAMVSAGWVQDRWSGSLEGGFYHGPDWDRWESDSWGDPSLSRDPEASGWTRGGLRWDFSSLGWAALGADYRGGWLMQSAASEDSTALKTQELQEGHRFGGTAEIWYRLGNLWNNTLAFQGRTGMLNQSESPLEIRWNTELEPEGRLWKIGHSLVWSHRPEGEIPRADLVTELSPSPLFTVRAGAEDWTSLFLKEGRKVPGRDFLEPGFKIFLSGKLNI